MDGNVELAPMGWLCNECWGSERSCVCDSDTAEMVEVSRVEPKSKPTPIHDITVNDDGTADVSLDWIDG